MVIDIIVLVLLAKAAYTGYQKGLVVALFSVVGSLLGFMAAVKLSDVVAAQLEGSVNVSKQYLPLIAFLLVFVGTIIVVNLLAKTVEKTVQWALLGWVNTLGGILLFLLMYGIIISLVLFYITQIKLFSADTIKASVTYPYLAPLAPKIMDGIGVVIPIFKDMFAQLEAFFNSAKK
jgi:membrane protein required for colicin V production